jgi:DNA invertase Pin-like site-specific DNA recombinase
MKKFERGDTLIVCMLDRLGRSLRDLIAMLDDLKTRGVKFQSLTEAIETGTPTGRAMWQMIGAELERSLISERTRTGVKAAKTRGVYMNAPGVKKTSLDQTVCQSERLPESTFRLAAVAKRVNCATRVHTLMTKTHHKL